jgi:hypothetical protein
MMMRRRPLLRMAAVGGVAYMGAKAGTNKAMAAQSAGAAPADPAAAVASPATAPAPEAQAANASDRIAQLQQLASLHTSGALTDEEFAAEKAKVLA